MREAHTFEITEQAQTYACRRSLGMLRVCAYDGLKIPLEPHEENSWSEFVGIYNAIYAGLSDNKHSQEKIFLSMYALNVAAQYVIAKTNAYSEQVITVPIDFEARFPEERIRNVFKGCLDYYLAQPESAREIAMNAILHHCARQSRISAADRPAIARSYETLKVRIDGKILGMYRAQEDEYTAQLSLDERVIGNQEMLEGLGSVLHALAHFDGSANPLVDYMKIPKTINIHGPPGSGKTMGIRQAYTDAKAKYESSMHVPFELLTLSNKFKSSLFSESGERLRALFRRANDNRAAYVIVAEDIESIFHDRRNLDANPEEKNIMNTLLNELEGLLTIDKGNYVFIATSNFPLQVDPALDQRLSELVLHAPGPQEPHEYAELFRNKLAKGIRVGYVQVNNWHNIGAQAAQVHFPGRHASRLSGRHIKDIVAGLNARTILPNLPQRILSRKQIESALARPLVTDVTIHDAIAEFALHHEAYLDSILAV